MHIGHGRASVAKRRQRGVFELSKVEMSLFAAVMSVALSALHFLVSFFATGFDQFKPFFVFVHFLFKQAFKVVAVKRFEMDAMGSS